MTFRLGFHSPTFPPVAPLLRSQMSTPACTGGGGGVKVVKGHRVNMLIFPEHQLNQLLSILK